MNFFAEGVEELRFATTKKVMEAMADLAADPTADPEIRIKAARTVDGMSDTIIKTYVATNALQANEKTVNKMVSQLEKLNDKEQ
jgi:hypothetical protein